MGGKRGRYSYKEHEEALDDTTALYLDFGGGYMNQQVVLIL